MPRLFSLLMILAIFTICLPSDWTRAQESNPKCSECEGCQKCPIAKKTSSFSEFELPGIDFPAIDLADLAFLRAAVVHGEKPGKQAPDGRSIDLGIQCECLKNSGIPFLMSKAGGSFTNVGLPQHKSGCTAPKTATSNGQCSTCTGETKQASCQTCKQASTCEMCQQDTQCEGCTDCQDCESCPATCPKTVQATDSFVVPTHPHGVQLVGYAETTRDENADPHRFEMREEMFEIRLENERLKMEVKAAEQMLEVMEDVMELREENAVLRTRMEFFEAHHDHAAKTAPSPHHSK